MKSGIYKITNIENNKFYIGSSQNIKRRTQGHLNALRKNKHHSTYLQNAFNKYGEDRFIFETVISCSIEELLTIEQYYIDFLKPHYNMSPTAGTTRGYKHQEKSFCSKFKPVYQIDPISLNIIKEYRSIKEGAKATNVDQSYISGVLLGNQYTAGGFIWCLVKEYSKEKILEISNLINKQHYKCRNIKQYDLNMNLIKEFDSIKFAAEQLGIKQARIGDALRRDQKTAGFIWKYV